MDLEAVDPLDWTVDQVVDFLCHSPSVTWSQSANPVRLPDPAAFADTLRENMVNGEVLLMDVEKETLREDLGLKALGARSTVLAAIRYLRSLSLKYQRVCSTYASTPHDAQPAYSPRMTPMTVSSHMRGSPLPHSHVPRQATPRQGTIHAPLPDAPPVRVAEEVKRGSNPDGNLSDRKSNGISPSSETATLPQTAIDDPVNSRCREISNPLPSRLSEEQIVARSTSPRLRPNEHFKVDSEGKKRRKLDLASRPPSQKQAAYVLQTAQSQANNWYMGPNRLDPMDIFYPIQPDYEAKETGFVTLSPELPIAQRLFIKDSLHHLFRQQPVTLATKDGCRRSAIFPCKSSLLGGDRPPFFTLYSSRNGQVTVTKEATENWPEFTFQSTQRRAPDLKDRDPFAYLMEKYPVGQNDEEALPLFGESGSEGEYDSDTLREMDEERRELIQRKPKYLTSHEVNSVIERCVRDYEAKWKREHLPKQEPKAHRIWTDARRNRNKNRQIKSILQEIERLERRLRKLMKEIRREEYAKVEELQFQCQSMEQTVYSIEVHKWRISVLERAECPPRVPVTSKPPPKKVRRDVDEESLDSESDVLADGSLDDFIEHDDPVYISTTDSDDMVTSPASRRSRRRQSNAPLDMSTSPEPPSAMPPAATEQLSPLSYMSLGGQDVEMIDLTKSRSGSPAEEGFEVMTPPLNPARPADDQEAITPLKMEEHSSPPFSVVLPVPQSSSTGVTNKAAKSWNRGSELRDIDVDDFKRIRHVKWSVLEDHCDRQRLLSKLIASLPDDERTNMQIHIPAYTRTELRSLTFQALGVMRKHATKLRFLNEQQNELVMRMASLFLSWNSCVRFTKKGIKGSVLDKAIANKDGFEDFADQLIARLAAYSQSVTRQVTPAADDASASAENSEDDLQAASSRTFHKKRKRLVKESHEVKMNHEAARVRVAVQEAQRRHLREKMESMGVGNNDPERQAVSFEHPIIYLDSHIGRRVKGHQLNGIQFMWRELIQDEKGEGCLLAHTMGLGKTMQV
jgi:hypothetical protein